MIAMCEDTEFGAYTGSMFSHRCARAEAGRFLGAVLPEACCGPKQELCPDGIPPLPPDCASTCAPEFERFFAECHPSFTAKDEGAYRNFLERCQASDQDGH